MFSNIFRNSLRFSLRQKSLIFWSLAFPIILATFFSLAFSNIYSSEKLDSAIKLAYVAPQNPNPLYNTAEILRSIKDEKDAPLFELQEMSLEDARDLVAEDKLEAAILEGDPPQMMVRSVSLNQVVTLQVLDSVTTIKDATFTLMKAGAPTAPQAISEALNKSSYTQEISFSKDRMNVDIIYFFALFAMACLGASQSGAIALIQQQANKSMEGARASVTASSKWLRVSAWGLAAFLVQAVLTLIVLLFTILVLGKYYGDSLGVVALLLCLGTLTGFLMGMALACVVRGSENTVLGLVSGLYLFSSFLSGLMSDQVKRMVDTAAPWLSSVNPGSMIVNSLYSLYYYQRVEMRYVWSMATACLVFVAIISLSLRRRYHDSI